VLLAIMHDRDTVAGRALAGLGADPDAARGYVAALVEDTGTPPEVLAALAARPPDPARRGLLRRRRRLAGGEREARRPGPRRPAGVFRRGPRKPGRRVRAGPQAGGG